MRIEPGVEQGHDLRCDGGMLAQRRPHVILRVGHAYLAQKARQRADQRDIAPNQPGGEHQRVIAVVFGAPAHDRKEARLEPFFERGEVERLAQRAFQRHVMEPDVGRVTRLDVVGALVDDAETHILQHRHALGERDRAAVAEDFQPGAGRFGG